MSNPQPVADAFSHLRAMDAQIYEFIRVGRHNPKIYGLI
jgi:hypothetical protein